MALHRAINVAREGKRMRRDRRRSARKSVFLRTWIENRELDRVTRIEELSFTARLLAVSRIVRYRGGGRIKFENFN